MAASIPKLPIGMGDVLQHAFLTLAIYTLWIIVYRLCFHPLAKFPGPRLAALTGLYEAYYEIFHEGGGRYYVEISRMHDKYGPIVRISPWEVHVRDAEWTDIYRVTRRTSKPVWFYRALGVIGNIFNSPSHEEHRRRRDVLQPMFTPAAALRHLPEVEAVVDKLHSRLMASKGQVVNMDDAYRCLATDVATGYAFGRPFGHLDHPDLDHESNSGLRKFARMALLNRQIGGWLVPLSQKMPDWMAKRMNKASTGIRRFSKQIFEVVDREMAAVAAEGAREKKAGPDTTTEDEEDGGETNLIRLIMGSDLPPEEKVRWRVARECSSVVIAGTETTGTFLSLVTVLLLNHPEKLRKLKDEIAEHEEKVGRKATYPELRDMPYLTGVMNEGFRISSAVSGRLPRVDERNDIRYREWVIPRGTMVSMTQMDIHLNPSIFHDPESFIPERWLDPAEKKRLAKYLQPFGRGTRMCLGMELAYADLYLNIGRLFSPTCGFELELVDVDFEKDVKNFHDFFSPMPRSTKGVRAVVK